MSNVREFSWSWFLEGRNQVQKEREKLAFACLRPPQNVSSIRKFYVVVVRSTKSNVTKSVAHAQNCWSLWNLFKHILVTKYTKQNSACDTAPLKPLTQQQHIYKPSFLHQRNNILRQQEGRLDVHIKYLKNIGNANRYSLSRLKRVSKLFLSIRHLTQYLKLNLEVIWTFFLDETSVFIHFVY